MKNRKNIFFRLLGAILTIAMIFSIAACTTPADTTEEQTEEATEAETEAVETMKVVVFSVKSVKGNLLNKYRLELADVPVTELPIDPITNIDDAIGKYLLEDANKGTCVSASMLGTMDPLVSAHGLGNDYVLITDVVNENPDMKDMSDIIQKAIEDNPGKTIYFPDGKYQLSRTVVIPSDPEKSVSFRLSNYANFTPSSTWNTESKAIIQYGTPESPKTQSGDHSDYFMGGIIDVDGKCTGIEIYGGGRLFVNNVAIKNAKIGINIKSNAAYNDIENVNVTGPEWGEVKGMLIEGTNNTFVNMRIYRITVGVHLTGGDNVLINIHPLFGGSRSNNFSSIGFHDQSTGNRYSICYSDQFTIGFKIDSQTKSYFDMCYMYWWNPCSYQIGFMCTGEFNSVISDTVVSMQNVKSEKEGGTENHYLYFVNEAEEAPEIPDEIPTAPNGTPNAPEETPAEPDEGETPTEPDDNEQENLPDEDENIAEENGSSTESKVVAASGSGVIINPTIQYSNNSDSDTYLQFVYNPK